MVRITVTSANGQVANGTADVQTGPRTTVSAKINGNPAFIVEGGNYTITWDGTAHPGMVCTGVPTNQDSYELVSAASILCIL